jgi:hypothetical protein
MVTLLYFPGYFVAGELGKEWARRTG